MKSWGSISASPAFSSASPSVKDEVRGHYKKSLAADPSFQALPQDEQSRVLRVIDGDGDYPIKLAASLVVASQKEVLGRAVVDPKEKDAIEDALKGAKSSEKYLDVPLKDRPREPFQDEIPGHLDKPLRALLGFMDDALPEYPAYKFWLSRSGESMEERLRNVLALSNTQKPVPVDANAAMNLDGFIRTYPELDRRLPTILPPLAQWTPEDQEKIITTDSEAALKHGLTQIQWLAPDRAVQTVLVHLLAGLKQGVPRAFRPDAVPLIVAAVKQKSYELLARKMYRLPSPDGSIPLDSEKIGETLLASAVLGPGMDQVADDFPSLFAVASGLAAVPRVAVGRYRTFIQNETKTPITPEWLLKVVTTGSFSLIKIEKIDEMLFQEAATQSGARKEQISHLTRDSITAATQPLLVSLMARSAQMDTDDFKKAQQNVRQKLNAAVQKQLKPPPPPVASPEPAEPDQIEQVHEDGVMATVIPHHMAFMDPDPGDPQAQEDPDRPAEAPEPTQYTPEPSSEAPGPVSDSPVLDYLKAHPISIKSVKKAGLLSDFKSFPGVLAKDGTPLDATLSTLIADNLLPENSDYNDLLDALDKRGVRAPPLGEESAVPPTTDAPPESHFTVRVAEVDPSSLIPTKTPSEIEPSRIRGVQQRFPEGKGYPAVTAQETKRGLELIDGHHRMMVAKERGDTLKAVVISQKEYKALEASGLGHTEISYQMLAKAGQQGAMEHLRQQYPDKKL